MFNYFKKMFMLTLRSEFAAGESIKPIDSEGVVEDINSSWTAIDELIQYYNSDRVIDNRELTDLHKKIDVIHWNTKTELTNLLNIIIASNKGNSVLTPEQRLKITSSQHDYPMKTSPLPTQGSAAAPQGSAAAPQGSAAAPQGSAVAQKAPDSLEKRTSDLIKLVNNDPTLTYNEKEGIVYIKVACPDLKIHRAFFTIEKNPDITDQDSLDTWKIKVTNALQQKHGEVPDKTKSTPTSEPTSKLTVEQETKRYTTWSLPKTNPDQWIYDTTLLEWNIVPESWLVTIKDWIITWEPVKIDNNKFYSIEAAREKITVNWDKLKAILNRQKNYNDRKDGIEPNRKTTLEYKGSPKETPTTNLDLKEVTVDKVKGLKDWKYQIMDGALSYLPTYNNITLEKSWNSLIISDEENNIWNISITPDNIEEALSLLPTILKEIHAAYKESHKSNNTDIKDAINSFKYSTSLVSLKEKQKELNSALGK